MVEQFEIAFGRVFDDLLPALFSWLSQVTCWSPIADDEPLSPLHGHGRGGHGHGLACFRTELL